MGTSESYIGFVCEKLERFGNIRSRKMFGEYMVYLNDKPILTVCDNIVFVKKLPQLSDIMKIPIAVFPMTVQRNVTFWISRTTGLLKK